MSPSPIAANLSFGERYAHLIDPNRKWYNNRRLLALNAWLVLILITSTANGFDNSLMNSFQSLDQWNDYFGSPNGGKLGVLNAIQNIGSLGSYPIVPYFSDGLGRKWTLWFGAMIVIVGVTLQGAAQNLGMFIGARFLIGFGLSFATQASPLLITELSYPPYRASLTSLYNSLYYSGNIIASWTAFGTANINNNWSWRIPSILQGVPSLCQFFLMAFAPESPRWLISKGREEQGLQVLAYYHADGNSEDPMVQYEFEEIKAALELDRASNKNVGWKSLIATPGNRKRMLLIIAICWFSQWSGNGLVSYYLNKVFDSIGITNLTIQLMITGILAVWNMFWAVGASFLVDKVGRRFLLITSCAGMLVFFTVQTICSAQYAMHQNANAAHAVIAFIFIYYAFYDIAFLPLLISYPVEILPYPIRAKGFTISSFTVSVALIFNQYVNPIALQHIAWKYYLVYIVWIAFELAFCYFLIVETKGLTLEETAALFDGEDATQLIAGQAAGGGVQDVRIEDKDYDEKNFGLNVSQVEVKA